MKRLLLVVIFAVLPAALFAQVADRDMILTPEGTLYTIESAVNDGSAPAEVSQYLRLTIQNGSGRAQTVSVPGSLTAGVHWRPALAYDSASKTLFVFWLKMPNAMSSELMLTSYSNGRWQPPFSVDNQPYRLRFNLRIGITHHVAQLQQDGSYLDLPALLLHAVWWEETGMGDSARYGLFFIKNGTVASQELYELNDFVPPQLAVEVSPTFNREILKHPAIKDSGSADAVDVIFGDSRTNTFNRIRMRPVADGRIHIPIGARPGGPPIGAPKSFSADWTGRISTITSPRDGSFLLYNTSTDSVSYIMYADGAWSTIKTLPLNDKLSADAAVAALSRMMNQ
jgi:hypothetical protein